MNRFRQLLLTIPISLGLAGCFPYHFVDRPGISGTVVDEADVPIANATVILRHLPRRATNTIADSVACED